MALKAQGNNQVNIQPAIIGIQNNNMLNSVKDLTDETLKMDTQCQTFISSTEGDIKAPYQQLHDLLIFNNENLKNNLTTRINKNKSYVSQMNTLQCKGMLY